MVGGTQLNASRCPRCHTSVQKISGCNKMTCPVCHIYFCYLCGIDLGSVNPYSHFSDVNAANCFQRLFDLYVQTNRHNKIRANKIKNQNQKQGPLKIGPTCGSDIDTTNY